MTASIEAMALQACNDGDTWHDFDSPEWRTRFAALVRAQALEDAACVAESTICDVHLPTGVRIYGTKAAAAIRALPPLG